MDPTPRPDLDPDRYFDLRTPGAHEWWYFDAISADGRDVLVIIFYAGLPFDPSYGVVAIRHVRNPASTPSPTPRPLGRRPELAPRRQGRSPTP